MKDTIGHCPYCTKVLFKDASFKDEADFETRCPHCRKAIVVEVQREFIIVVKPKIQVSLSNEPNDSCGKPC